MPPQVASVVFYSLIALLFYLDRDRKLKTSTALWIPVLWLLINGSRPVSLWMATASASPAASECRSDTSKEAPSTATSIQL